MFANERDNYAYYANTLSFATTPACVDKKDGPLSGFFKWTCDIQHPDPNVEYGGIFGAAKNTSAVTKPASSVITGGGTKASKNCQGCSAGNIGCEIGKLSCEFTKAAGDAVNSTGSWAGGGFDMLGKYWPFMAIGGVAIIAILLIKK